MPRLYQPVKPWRLSQKFGENRACVLIADGVTTIECDGNNPPKGYKSLYGKRGHEAIDIPTKHGQPVYASCDGSVAAIDTDPRTGLDVKIEWMENGIKYRLVYEHLLGYQVKLGDKIRLGQVIGWADNTGWSSGDHLHFQLYKWDKKWVSVDPMLYMFPKFAGDFATLPEKIATGLDAVVDKLRQPKDTTVSYDQAIRHLQAAGLPQPIYENAVKILKLKYGIA